MINDLFCCASFRDLVNEGGRKGFAIVPFKNPLIEDDYVYFLQSRSADFDDGMSRHIVIDMTIKYCPFCGTRLSEVTKINRAVIMEIAKKNKKFITV